MRNGIDGNSNNNRNITQARLNQLRQTLPGRRTCLKRWKQARNVPPVKQITSKMADNCTRITARLAQQHPQEQGGASRILLGKHPLNRVYSTVSNQPRQFNSFSSRASTASVHELQQPLQPLLLLYPYCVIYIPNTVMESERPFCSRCKQYRPVD